MLLFDLVGRTNLQRILIGQRRRKLRRLQHCAQAAQGSRRKVRLRQVEREGAAFARRATETNLAAEQSRQFAADRKTQARAAVLAAGRAVRLLERLEDNLLLLRRNAN